MRGSSPRMTGGERRDKKRITMTTAISPLAPAQFPDLPAIDGVRLPAAAPRTRSPRRPDLRPAPAAPPPRAAGGVPRPQEPRPPRAVGRAPRAGGAPRG